MECGDLSPLSLPERLVAQAEPRRAARHMGWVRTLVIHASFSMRRTASVFASLRRDKERGAAGTTSRRNPYPSLGCHTLTATSSRTRSLAHEKFHAHENDESAEAALQIIRVNLSCEPRAEITSRHGQRRNRQHRAPFDVCLRMMLA